MRSYVLFDGKNIVKQNWALEASFVDLASGEIFSGVTKFVAFGKRIEPNPDNVLVYDAGYTRYRGSYDALTPVFKGGA